MGNINKRYGCVDKVEMTILQIMNDTVIEAGSELSLGHQELY